jgi:protein-S-isoprenylcysteine O-methyltransferase Ste14
MATVRTCVYVVWGSFWAYWLFSAASAKRGLRPRRRGRIAAIVAVLAAVAVLRAAGVNGLDVRSLAIQIVGVCVLLGGLAFAVWARIYLGRNWGTPMTEKLEPELVTSGPYQYVRHPIYTGILLAMLGTAIATNLFVLLACLAAGVYFVYSARVEEGLMTRTFPAEYPGYRARTKMLIPFLL